MQEVWKKVTVVPYGNVYEVSNFGRVRHVNGRVRKLTLNKKRGYLCVCLHANGTNKTFYVHRLVVLAFLGTPPSDMHEVRHIDGNSVNNKTENLAWGTKLENAADKRKHNTTAIGDKNGSAIIPDWGVKHVFALRKRGWAQWQIARVFRVTRSQISNILRGVSRRGIVEVRA